MLGMLLLLVACGDKGADPCDSAGLSLGSMEATLDGGAWGDSDGAWSWAGSSVQVYSTSSEGWLVSLTAQTEIGGADLETAVAEGVFPIEVDLLEGGFATLYPDGESFSYASNKASGGTLLVTGMLDGGMQGCFDFEAASTDGATVVADGGAFNVEEL